MAFLTQVATLVSTAVLGLDSASPPDLARLAFGALLWIVLIILNRGAAGASSGTLALEVGPLPSPRRRREPPEAVRDGRRVATRIGHGVHSDTAP
jgi:hypothetical protein